MRLIDSIRAAFVGRADHLPELAALLGEQPYLNGSAPGMEDIIIFPVLRNLTLVKGIVFPAKLQAYIERLSAESKVPLYSERAL